MQNLPVVVAQHLPCVVMFVAEDPELAQKFKAMQESFEELRETLATETKEVAELLTKLNSNNCDVLAEIIACNQELDLILDANSEDSDDLDAFRALMEEDDEADGETSEIDEEVYEQHVKKALAISKMFKEIALKTHPDRTKNGKMIDLFMQAQKAYKEGDLEELYRIHAKVFNKPYVKVPLEDRLKALELQFNIVFQEFSQHRQSDEYKLFSIAQNYGEGHANQAHRALLKEILSQRKRDLAHAREI